MARGTLCRLAGKLSIIETVPAFLLTCLRCCWHCFSTMLSTLPIVTPRVCNVRVCLMPHFICTMHSLPCMQ